MALQENTFPKRKTLHLKDCDYSAPGAYFVTICTHNRKNTLSSIVGAIRESPLQVCGVESRSTLSKAVGYIKMNATKEIRRTQNVSAVWQRGYHDHVIRHRRDYEEIAVYIRENPLRWRYDCFYTE